MKSRHSGIINLVLVLIIIVVVNALSSYVNTSFDLTQDRRFTLTDPTVDLLEQLDKPIYVQVLMAGKLPVEFQRLQDGVIDMLEQYKKLTNGLVQYELVDPGAGSVEQINKKREDLSKERIFPMNIRVVDGDERKEQLVYPYVTFRLGERVNAVNVLESGSKNVSPEVQLNNSVSLLEYKYSNAIQKLMTPNTTNIAFLAGHGEYEKNQTIDLENNLRKFHNSGRLYLDSVYKIDERINLVIVAHPTKAFPEKHKFMLDQYLMKGGKIIWLVDKLNINMDSIRQNRRYVPFDYDLNLDDFFFKHGIRINSDLVQDLDATRIPLTVGQAGGRPRFELYPWYYHILALPKQGHPITNNLDRVNMYFPSTIDTLKTKYKLHKEVLLTSSKNSRFQLTPVQLDLNVVRVPIVPEKFNKSFLPVGVLLEGQFASLYENRVTKQMEEGLAALGETFSDKSVETKMLVISDADVIFNKSKPGTDEFFSMGFNVYEGVEFANKPMILNSIEYMIGDGGILQSRTKDLKLRLLDTVRARKEKLKWQLINVASPLVLLIVFGILFQFWRRRKYGRKV